MVKKYILIWDTHIMFCEMCGKNVPKTQKVRVEGTVLLVCDSCAHFGVPVDPPKKQVQTVVIESPPKSSTHFIPKQKVNHPKKKQSDSEDIFVVPEYAQIVREARERLSWTQEDLASKLLEKKNVLSKIERGDLQPDIKLARKLEKLLDIKLLESF